MLGPTLSGALDTMGGWFGTDGRGMGGAIIFIILCAIMIALSRIGYPIAGIALGFPIQLGGCLDWSVGLGLRRRDGIYIRPDLGISDVVRQMKTILVLLGISLLALLVASPVSATATLPAGETHLATYITATSATLNGYVTDDGGEACQARFQYYYGIGTWTDNATPWLTGYVTGDSPTANITGLTDGELYYCRMEIENSAGTFDADSEIFSAYDAPSMPSSWFATPDVERFKNAFFYGMYNFLADEIKMPRANILFTGYAFGRCRSGNRNLNCWQAADAGGYRALRFHVPILANATAADVLCCLLDHCHLGNDKNGTSAGGMK